MNKKSIRNVLFSAVTLGAVSVRTTHYLFGLTKRMESINLHVSDAPFYGMPEPLLGSSLCSDCKAAHVGSRFSCVDRIKRHIMSRQAFDFEEAQRIVSREYKECSVCDPSSCKVVHAPTQENNASISTSKTSSNEPLFVSEIDKGPLLLDFLSVGSQSRLDLQQTQKSTFGSHPSVRHFFNVTEDDDVDRFCSRDLTLDSVMQISTFCRGKEWSKASLMAYQRNHYALDTWLKKKSDPVGWMCAQKRPIHGLTKVLNRYAQNATLPDFLVIMDDDSYYQVDLVQKELQKYNADNAHVIAGCMIRSRIYESNFTFPFGGWGTILSRGAIVNLMRPLYCQGKRQRDEFERNACNRLQENQLEEHYLFKEGMSVAQLMEAYAAVEPFTSHSNWTHGFCLHSDWALGFFFNFYFIGIHSGGRKHVPHDRMTGYMGSEIYDGKKTAHVKKRYRQCKNDSPEKCTSKSHICHYQTPESMKTLTSQWMRNE